MAPPIKLIKPCLQYQVNRNWIASQQSNLRIRTGQASPSILYVNNHTVLREHSVKTSKSENPKLIPAIPTKIRNPELNLQARKLPGGWRKSSPKSTNDKLMQEVMDSLEALRLEHPNISTDGIKHIMDPVVDSFDSFLVTRLVKKVPHSLGAPVYFYFASKSMVSKQLTTYFLTTLLRKKQWAEAECVLMQIREKELFINCQSYNLIISRLTDAGKYHKANLWFQDFKSSGQTANKELLTSCVKLLTKLGKKQEAEEMCGELRKYPADQQAMCRVINVYGWIGRLEEAENAFEEVRAAVPRLEEFCWTAMASAYRRAGSLEKTEKLMNEMAAAGHISGALSHETLINAYGDVKMWDKGLRVFKNMERDCIPRRILTYNCVLSLLVKKAKTGQGNNMDLQEVEDLMRGMKADGVLFDMYTYNNLIWLYGHAGEWREALRLFQQLQEEDLKPSPCVYGTVINSILRANRSEEAVQLYREMKLQGLLPEPAVLVGLVDALRELGLNKEIQEVLKLTRKRGVIESSDQVQSSAAISLYSKAGNFMKASNIFESMRLRGNDLDAVSYCTMMDTYGRNNQLGEAQALFEEGLIATPNEKHSYLYGTMINLYHKHKKSKQALSLFKRLRSSGLALNDVTYNIMIDLYGKCGNMDMATKLFEEMNSSGTTPSVYTYSTMIHLYGQSNKYAKAVEIFSEMQDKEIQPTFVTYNTILAIYRKAKMYEEAQSIYDFMKAENIQRTNVTYATMILMYEEAEMFDKALDVYGAMRLSGVQIEVKIYNYMMRISAKLGKEDLAREFKSRRAMLLSENYSFRQNES